MIFFDKITYIFRNVCKTIVFLYTDKNWNIIDAILLLVLLLFDKFFKTTNDSLFLLKYLIFMLILSSILIRHLLFLKIYKRLKNRFLSNFMKFCLKLSLLLSIVVIIEFIYIIISINI